jgi:nitrate reductase gamma subunit
LTQVLYAAMTLSVAAFAGASVARAWWYARHPIHLRWELYPVPHEGARAAHGGSSFETTEFWQQPRHVDRRAEFRFMAREILLLHALRESNRSLWYCSYPFHAGLYLLSAAVGLLVLVALATVAGTAPAGGTARVVSTLSGGVGGLGAGLAVAGAVALLWRRASDPRLRSATTPGDIFNLAFFIAALGTLMAGYASRGPQAPDWPGLAIGWLTWDTSLRVPGLLATGVVLCAVLLAYIPLTHMSHFIGKYFTYHAVRWNDRPAAGDPRITAAMTEVLTYRPSWSAGHISGDGGATWADVASKNPAREVKP